MSKNPKPEPDFEATLAELEELVERLEVGQLSLDESLAGFKQGIELTRRCQSVLDRAEQTIQQLLDNQDEDSLKPLDEDD
ncbi:MAG: exodeoxyribonuclease VII small subunit [Lysobacterales bacterium]|jgi:exodeoxyribonuclease VII small subunit